MTEQGSVWRIWLLCELQRLQGKEDNRLSSLNAYTTWIVGMIDQNNCTKLFQNA
jgi:hypothetical protein